MVVELRIRGRPQQPILDPLGTVMHRAHGHDVAHVVVDGQVVFRSGRLVKVDERALVDEAKEVGARYLRRARIEKQEVMACKSFGT